MELGQKEIDELIENCKKNNAGLHDVKGFEDFEFVEKSELWSEEREVFNSFEHPDVIRPKTGDAEFNGGILRSSLKKLSWNVFRFKRK